MDKDELIMILRKVCFTFLPYESMFCYPSVRLKYLPIFKLYLGKAPINMSVRIRPTGSFNKREGKATMKQSPDIFFFSIREKK